MNIEFDRREYNAKVLRTTKGINKLYYETTH